ncbi:MAG: M13-type metalloendopeptidase [Bacteroidota bacterium]
MQRFFISYASVWRMSIRNKDLMRKLKEDVHSPGIARVNAVVCNITEFYDAFILSESDSLFLAAVKRTKIMVRHTINKKYPPLYKCSFSDFIS